MYTDGTNCHAKGEIVMFLTDFSSQYTDGTETFKFDNLGKGVGSGVGVEEGVEEKAEQ